MDHPQTSIYNLLNKGLDATRFALFIPPARDFSRVPI